MNWITIGHIDEIPLRGARCVKTPEGKIAVFRTAENEVFAIEDHCPHKGGPLSQGIVFGHRVACPLHNWTIGLADGCAKAPDEGCTPKFSVHVEAGVVHLDATELATLALDQPAVVAGPAGKEPVTAVTA